MDFEWDENKRLTNIAKHGLDFRNAVNVFDGDLVEAPGSQVKNETRWLATGILNTTYVTIICTYRGDVCRIISFRRARDGEKRGHQALYGR